MKHIIYGMSEDGEISKIRYVGSTIFSMEKRLKEHIKYAKRCTHKGWLDKTHRAKWIRQVLRKGKIPKMHLLDSKDEYDDFIEQYWIEKLKSEGYNLVNHARGGRAFYLGKHHTKSVKEKLRKARLGYKVSEDVKKKQRLGGNPYATKVIQFDKSGNFIKLWNCVQEASIATGCDHGQISLCCQKNAYLKKTNSRGGSSFFTAHGYVWRYEGNIQPKKKTGNKVIKRLEGTL